MNWLSWVLLLIIIVAVIILFFKNYVDAQERKIRYSKKKGGGSGETAATNPNQPVTTTTPAAGANPTPVAPQPVPTPVPPTTNSQSTWKVAGKILLTILIIGIVIGIVCLPIFGWNTVTNWLGDIDAKKYLAAIGLGLLLIAVLWGGIWKALRVAFVVIGIILVVSNFGTIAGWFGWKSLTKVKVFDGPPTIYTVFPSESYQTILNLGPQRPATDRSYDVIGGVLEGTNATGSYTRLGDGRHQSMDGPKYRELHLRTLPTLLAPGNTRVQLIFQDYHWENKRD